MHCSLVALNNGRTFSNLSELLRALLWTRCKYCLHCRTSVLVTIADTTRLCLSSHLSEIIFCLIGLAYPLIKRIVRKALSLSASMVVNMWLSFKQEHLFDSTHILSISVFVKKISINSCGNRVLSKTVTGSFHAFNCCHTELSMCFQLAVLHFFVT